MQITLDGDKLIHDQRRYLSDGGGTFDNILENIKIYSQYFRVAIRVNIDNKNKNDINQLIRRFEKMNNVYMYVALVDNINDNYENEKCLDIEEYAIYESSFNEKIGNFSLPEKNLLCMSNVKDGVVIGPNGEFYKCWNHVGYNNLIVGNVKEGICYNDAYNDFVFDKDLDNDCKKCEVLPLCFGGCSDYRIREGKKRCLAIKYNINDKVLSFAKQKKENKENEMDKYE